MGAFSEQFPIDGLRRVELRLHRGDVQIVRTSDAFIQVSADNGLSSDISNGVLTIGPGGEQYHEARRGPKVSARLERGDLGASISQIVTDAVDSIFKSDFLLHGLNGASVRLGIPAGLERPEIVVSTGSGDIHARGLTADCSLQSHSGDVEVAEGAGTLQVTTGLGDLKVSDYDGPITGRTGSGDARFDRCGGGGVVHTGSGDVDAKQISGPWKLNSGAGDISVEVRDEAVLEIGTGAGDVRVTRGTLGQLTVQSGSGDVECTSLLSGPRHQLQTGNGDIDVAIANPPGARLQVLTRNGDVDSEYPLVMVGKQGRHSHGGARYVGNIGDSMIDLELRTASGDISIRRRESEVPDENLRQAQPATIYATTTNDRGFSAPRWPASPPPVPPNPPEMPIPPFPPAVPVYAVEVEPATEVADDLPATGEIIDEPPIATTGGNPRLAVLENLQAGKISVAEAAALLESIGRSGA
jgi:DUF4097 and DUF4098 domain-containing protein YvlB